MIPGSEGNESVVKKAMAILDAHPDILDYAPKENLYRLDYVHHECPADEISYSTACDESLRNFCEDCVDEASDECKQWVVRQRGPERKNLYDFEIEYYRVLDRDNDGFLLCDKCQEVIGERFVPKKEEIDYWLYEWNPDSVTPKDLFMLRCVLDSYGQDSVYDGGIEAIAKKLIMNGGQL